MIVALDTLILVKLQRSIVFQESFSLSLSPLSVRTRARVCVRVWFLHYYRSWQLDILDMIMTYFWAKVELFAFPLAGASIATKIKWTLYLRDWCKRMQIVSCFARVIKDERLIYSYSRTVRWQCTFLKPQCKRPQRDDVCTYHRSHVRHTSTRWGEPEIAT